MSQRNTTWIAALVVVAIGSVMASQSPAVHEFFRRLHGM
jgi:hypothetical protein